MRIHLESDASTTTNGEYIFRTSLLTELISAMGYTGRNFILHSLRSPEKSCHCHKTQSVRMWLFELLVLYEINIIGSASGSIIL